MENADCCAERVLHHNDSYHLMHRSSSTSNTFKENLFNTVSDARTVFQENYSELLVILALVNSCGADSVLHGSVLSIPDKHTRQTWSCLLFYFHSTLNQTGIILHSFVAKTFENDTNSLLLSVFRSFCLLFLWCLEV